MQWIDSASDRAGRPLPPRLLEPGDQPLALFVDLDGRFIERATLASAERLDADLVCLLARLHYLLGGALAVISTRRLADVDRLLKPLELPAAVLADTRCRDATGRIRPMPTTIADKGDALATLMRLPPFRGRAPVMLGDHASAEPAFARAQELGGVGMVVGSQRPTRARHALGAPRQAGRWLAALASRLEQERVPG